MGAMVWREAGLGNLYKMMAAENVLSSECLDNIYCVGSQSLMREGCRGGLLA